MRFGAGAPWTVELEEARGVRERWCLDCWSLIRRFGDVWGIGVQGRKRWNGLIVERQRRGGESVAIWAAVEQASMAPCKRQTGGSREFG